MRYHEARSGIRDGDVLLFRGKGFFSSLIRWRTRSSVTHVGLALWIDDRLMVVESREMRGCRLVPLSSAIGTAQVSRHMLDPRLEQHFDRSGLRDAALSHLGQPYGWQQILRFALSALPLPLLRLLPWVGRLVPRGPQWSEDDAQAAERRMTCSAFASYCYRVAGYDLVRRLADGDTSPGDIARSAALAYAGELRP